MRGNALHIGIQGHKVNTTQKKRYFEISKQHIMRIVTIHIAIATQSKPHHHHHKVLSLSSYHISFVLQWGGGSNRLGIACLRHDFVGPSRVSNPNVRNLAPRAT